MSNRKPTLRQLEIYIALAKHKNISRVAEALHISQPSVSIQLKNLAEIFDVQLYSVVGRNIELTQPGEVMLKTAEEMFYSLDKLSIEIDNLKGIKSGTLKLSVVSTAKYFLPILLGEFCKRYPLIDIALNVGNREKILKRFNESKDDYYVFSQYPESDNVIAESFLDNPIVVIAPVNHELTQKKPISLNRLSHYPFLLRELGSGTRKNIDALFKKHKLTLKVKMVIESNEAIKQSVAAGLGLSILSRHTLGNLKNSNLTILDVQHFPLQSQWYLVRKNNREQTALAHLFHEYLQQDGLSTLQRVADRQAKT